MKILLVHNSYQRPGGEDIVFEQERGLLERMGHQVVVYQRSNLEIEESSAARRIALVQQIVWSTNTEHAFTRLLDNERPQLVHIHNTFFMVSPSVYWACDQADIPVVQTLHNYRLLCPAATLFRDGHVCEECIEHSLWRGVRYGCYRGSRSATAAVALMLAVHRNRHTWDRQVDAYLALTEFARTRFVAGGLPPERIFVKPNFVYPDPGARLSTGTYAVFAGRLSSEKVGHALLAAWERLGSRIALLIVGDGPERRRLELQASKLRRCSVSFLGHVAREEAWTAIGNARCLVMPSECYENFPLTIIEAFACGTPVICSRVGAMQEIVADGRTGLHFTPGDADDLAAKLEWACMHPEQMKVMGQEARLEYEMKYTAERNYDLLAGAYQQILRRREPFGPREPQPKLGWRVHVRRTQDLLGKAWAQSVTALEKPEQLLQFPALLLKRVHIGEFLKLNKPWLKNAGIRTVLDVGAHTGEFSSAIRAVLPDVQIYAFEPLPDCCRKLKERIRGNGSLQVFQVALGDGRGPVDFWRSSFSKSSSLLRMCRLHQEAFPWSAGSRPVVVQLERLDDYADKMSLVSKTLLKIDVQGYEDRVLQGATQLLKQVNYVIVEVSVSPLYDQQAQFDGIYKFLLELGFSYHGNLEQLTSPLDGNVLQVDALFSRP